MTDWEKKLLSDTMEAVAAAKLPKVLDFGNRDWLQKNREMPPEIKKARRFGAHATQAHCAKHGMTEFDVNLGVCKLCYREYISSGLPSFTASKALAGDRFKGHCAVHGESVHVRVRGQTHPCLECMDPDERARRDGIPVYDTSSRASARRLGLSKYTDVCAQHGETEHHINTGKCLTCFTSTGAPRKGSARTARSAARRAGLDRYFAPCDLHGESEHHVNTGKCLTCFTSGGVPRDSVRAGLPVSPRVSARREGRSRYLDHCPQHGVSDHHVNTGKCLTCFTASGLRRVQSQREEARSVGLELYPAPCRLHGDSHAWVTSGKCYHCYDENGAARRAPLRS